LEEFLKPLGISQYRLAKEIDVPPQRIGEIVAGKRAVSADTEVAQDALGETIAKIRPWRGTRAHQTAAGR
jgi:addiction module HigA family antidote